MANTSQSYPSMNEGEFDALASVLEARHGLYAAAVADFFASLHTGNGDQFRSGAWADVAERVRERERNRLHQD